MKKNPVFWSQCLLGIIFLLAGLNGYWVIFGKEPWLPTSPEAVAFFDSIPYMLILEKTVEAVCGVLLLLGRFVPLTLIVLAPVIVNIVAFHLFVDKSLLPLAVLLAMLELYLLWKYRAHFAGILQARANPK